MISNEPPRLSAPPLDRIFWLAVLIVAGIVIPRSFRIARAHSASMDDQFHLRRGLYYLTGKPKNMALPLEDGLLGQAIDALPMLFSGSTMDEPINFKNMPDRGASPFPVARNASQKFAQAARQDVLFGHALSPDAILMRIAIFKSILFIPFAAILFYWSRWLYGVHSGLVALALLLIDPSFASHIPIAAIDVIGVEAIVIASFVLWLWVRQPSTPRLIFAAFTSAFALLTKQTAVMVPVIAVGYAALWWLRNPDRVQGRTFANYRVVLNRLAKFFLLFFLFIWVLTKFDYSRPSDLVDPILRPAGSHFSLAADILYPALQHYWPAGTYIAAFVNSVRIDAAGRWAFLFGYAQIGGWWYYYPVLLALKAPLGFFVVFALAVYSLRLRRPFFEEWSLLLPALLWGALLVSSHVNIGIRHFLPEYAFIMILGSRCVVRSTATRLSVFIGVLVWLALDFAAGSVIAYEPDYLSYINFPYAKPWLLMNDSNIDWGQGLKQVREYLDEHPTKQPIYLRYDWGDSWRKWYLDDRVQALSQFQATPRHGLLIICPVWVAGYWDPMDAYGFLRSYKPKVIIGHSMLVYDLDHLSK